MRTLVVRAGTGPRVGTGHLARCLALVQAWVDGGDDAALVADDVPDAWATRYRAEGAAVLSAAKAPAADWVVLDGYEFGAAAQEAAARTGRLMVVDDHGQVDSHRADLVLDHNPGATDAPYRPRRPGFDLLLGSRYALMRREVRKNVGLRVVPERAATLLVALGGSPSPEVLDVAHAALGDGTQLGLRLEWLSGVDDVVAPMRRADLAVAGAGVTASELCALGVPALLVTLADNQRAVARALQERGAAMSLGDLGDLDSAELAGAVHSLAADPKARRAMVEAGQRLVDGRGALRVSARLRAELLRLRRATTDDARRLWEWVNDPVVRQTSFSPEPVPWETHTAWLEQKLRDPACSLWMVEDTGGASIGQVRVDVDGDEAVISVGLAPESRSRGLGPAAIDAAARRALDETAATTVVARIRGDNAASLTAFGDAGFEWAGEGADGGIAWLRYARSR